ncbi:MAG: MBOAT family protein [Oscillospiraceae bacterium]|nr:MBOAT family protein [Oscillospiraceae bacterium]
MVFSGLLFIFIYLPVTLAVYYLSPPKWRNAWLFAANLIFYGWGEPVYVLLMVFSVALNYASGLLIAAHRDRGRAIVAVNTALNLALLIFFKYYDFIAENLSAISFLSFMRPIGVTLPIGISFYTFQTMSYPIDVYRGDAEVQKNFVSFGTFVSLFPQLIAGPIIRYKSIASQLSERRVDVKRFSAGVTRFCAGLAKKVLLANNIGALWDVYASRDPSSLSAAGAWLGAIAFSFQIYFDFSGYSDMAIGLGHMLGFDFCENFSYPYISRSITEFWRRWHISLGTWFRDYVYIPLGGNRRGLARQLVNICIVWALTGIWHGASWNFLLWGVYYAVLLMLEKLFLLRALDRAPAAVGHVYSLLLVILGWVLFSVEDIGSCLRYISAMFGGGSGLFSGEAAYYLRSFGPTLAVLIVASTPLPKKLYSRLPDKAVSVLTPVLTAAALLLCTAYLTDSTYNPFLYFRF